MSELRPARVTCALPPEALQLVRMTGEEALGRAYHFELDLFGDDALVKLPELLGKPMTVHLDLEAGKTRHFGGLCSRIVRTGGVGRHTAFRATVRPWLWFLTRSSDCRIFQNMTVPDIVKQVFRERGFSDFEDALTGSYREWEYLVQYRETDFNFVTRLMEQEGIYFYFKHEESSHKLVLADAYGAHAPVPGYEKVPFYPPDHNARRARDYIDRLALGRQVQPGTVVLDTYDFERPRADLMSKLATPREHDHGDLEVFDYPGPYVASGDGEGYARARLEALQAEHEQVEGDGTARGLGAGALFSLSGFPREDHNREYLVTGARYTLSNPDYESHGSGTAPVFLWSFSALDSRVPYRTARSTPKPHVSGPQTARVVGPKGEEIWTDKHGRVKVQFHWDRRGKADEQSSCWVRVAQLWAGARWGAMFVPRVGHEVVVDFLEGDPDQPIITGRVYNAENMPPWELPAHATQSGIRSKSSKGGGPDNHNEIRFEDKKGAEELFIQAERDQTILVKNDERISVGRDRGELVARHETIAIGGARDEKVALTETVAIGGARSVVIGAADALVVVGGRTVEIGKGESLAVGGDRQAAVVGNETVKVGKNRALAVDGDRSSVTAGHQSAKVGKTLTVDAGDQITFKAGKASLTLKKDGTIVLEGKNLSLLGADLLVKGSGAIDIKATKEVRVKGRAVKHN